jgi:hypothetical protein
MIAPETSEIEERFATLKTLNWGEFQRFLNYGVSSRALVYPELPARARVVFEPRARFFDFADERGDDSAAKPAFIFIARDEFSEACDLIAWEPSSGRLAPWYGRARILGAENLYAPRILNEGALPVCETPLDWLRAERLGVVILNAASARWHLDGMGLIVGNAAFGRSLRDALRWPEPRIVVENLERAAA